MDRGLPPPQFKLRPSHAFYLIDVVLAVVIFIFVGRYWVDHKGGALKARGAADQAAAQTEIQLELAQADSVMKATRDQVAAMRADSASRAEGLEHRKAILEQGFQDRQNLAQELGHLADAVLNMRNQSEEALTKVQGYQRDLTSRRDEIGALEKRANADDSLLAQTSAQRSSAAEGLRQAYDTRTYEPVGMFPDKSSLVLRREMGNNASLTNVEFQHVLVRDPRADVGVSLGLGLGSGDHTASKSLGLLLSRPLIHRRLGLDLGAGFSVLTSQDGSDEGGPYASAGLRLSPFYAERFHLGVGARAGHGEVQPYIGVVLGRR